MTLSKTTKTKLGSVKSLASMQLLLNEDQENDTGVAALKRLMTTESWVYITVDAVASELSNVPLKIYQKEIVDSSETYTENASHPLNTVIKKPNNLQQQSDFIYSICAEFCLIGNALIYPIKSLNKIYVLPAQCIEPVIGGYKYDDGKQTLNLKSEDIIHIKRYNPESLYWGLSPFIPTKKAVDFNKYSKDFLNAFYQKGATPQVALSLDKNASEQAVTRMLRSFEMAYTGRKNMRRTLLLPKGVTLTALNISLADQKLIEFINQNKEEILNALRVPKHALGLQTSGSLGSEEHKQALKYFWQATLKPMGTKIEQAFTEFYAQELGVDNKFMFDYSNIDILKDDEVKKADLTTKLLSTHTINEIRKQYYNLPPVSGGDTIASIQVTPEIPVTTTQEQPVIREEISQEVLLALDTHKEKINAHTKRLSDIEEEKYKDNLVVSAKLISNQGVVSLDTFIKTANTKALNDEVDPKKLADIKKELEKELAKLKDEYVEQMNIENLPVMEAGYQEQMRFIFNEENRAAIEVIGEKNKQGRREVLEQRNINTFNQLSETSTNLTMNVIEQGMKDKKTIRQIAQDIGDKYKTQLGFRAERIARTEILTAVSIGQDAQAKDALKVLPDLQKMWLNMGDDRVRDSHKEPALIGKFIPYDQKFINDLRFPRDPNANKPADVIQCRCSMLTLSKKDIDALKQ